MRGILDAHCIQGATEIFYQGTVPRARERNMILESSLRNNNFEFR